jgi:Na+/melibiose symporter-like transporter
MPSLPFPRLLGYALPALPLAALTLPLYSFVPTFYAEAIGVPLAAIGTALLLVRVFDALNDPVIGWAADRFRPPFGRRRTWFLASIPVLILGVWQVFVPPVDAGAWHLGLWSLALSVAYTTCILPYTAWGAELATDYAERSRITGTREALTLLGTLVAVALPLTIGWERADELHGFAWLAIFIAVSLPIFALLAVLSAPEPVEHSTTRLNLRDGIDQIRHNRPFLRLALAFFLNNLGNSVAATLFLLFCSARLGLEELRGPLLFVYFLSGVISVPFWTWMSRKTSKHRAWCIAMLFAMIVFAPAPFLPEGAAIAFGAVCILSGLALGADIALPPSMQADVIDVDTARSGEQRSGIYFALWSLATKMSLALAVFIGFAILDFYGFSADQPETSTTAGLTALAFIYGFGPIILKIPAVALMWSFPLGRKEVEDLRATIDAHRAAG